MRHAFFGIDVAVDRFLAHSDLGAFIDHPIADLLRRPAMLELSGNLSEQLWICVAGARRSTAIRWTAAP